MTTTKVITKVQNNPITIPDKLLEVDELEKPKVKKLSDVTKAYINLKKNYDILVLKITEIKNINEKHKTIK